MGRSVRAISVSVVSLAAALAGAACSTSTATSCGVDSRGNAACATYASAYPYDYAYYDPLYATTWGYYPYYVDSYYDPAGYTYFYASVGPLPVADPVTGSNVPELLDRAHRAANAVDVAVRAALDPIAALIKTTPLQGGDSVIYGPGDVGGGSYRLTIKQLSSAQPRFAWKLEARPANSTAGLSLAAAGTIQVGSMPRRGHGTLGIDCDTLGAADATVTCRGRLLMGFAHTDDGDKILNVGLGGYTPNPSVDAPLDAEIFDWRHGDTANHARLVARTNLSATATSAPETVTMKLTWVKGAGVRVDAVASGGDVAPGQILKVSTCAPATLDPSRATTSTETCNSDGSGCAPVSGSMSGSTTVSCASGLETADDPMADPMASDPPAGMPEMPAEPTAMPDGNGD